MKKFLLILLTMVVIGSCARKGDHSADLWTETSADSSNQILYNQVMDIHDEVMPRMEDIYNLKKDLQEKIANTPGLVEEERKKLENRIAQLDSVSNLMMDWMHQFNPPPDTADQEQNRAYLESEMEKIRRVKAAMLEAIDKEKSDN